MSIFYFNSLKFFLRNQFQTASVEVDKLNVKIDGLESQLKETEGHSELKSQSENELTAKVSELEAEVPLIIIFFLKFVWGNIHPFALFLKKIRSVIYYFLQNYL